MIGDRRLLTIRDIVALGMFVLAFDGLLNMVFARGVTDGAIVAKYGGMLGLVISSSLANAMGTTGALIISAACLLVSVILLLNTSLRTLLSPLLSVLGLLRKREADEDGEEVEEDVPFDEREDVEKAEAVAAVELEVAEEDEDSAPYVAPAEQVMTTASRRKIEVPPDLLDDRSSDAKPGDIERGKEIIERTFAQFGIPVEMSDVKVGPTVTQYALHPAQGVKLARIVALQNDLALALAAHPIRIEAPIPGKSLVGIEVPNQTIGRVCLRELLDSKEFKHRKTAFTVPIGKDISGLTQLLAVEKAPHMLVAGATGSGKSVCLNTIIVSLIYQNGPDDLKLIMVDPKRVELGVYTGIPHLLIPPITKVEEAINALKWAVREMERRLDHLASTVHATSTRTTQRQRAHAAHYHYYRRACRPHEPEQARRGGGYCPHCANARASGIHLILATQRPSVDVITGTIKANIPTRLAFAVASQVDSKTILDMGGAEKLLGRGDMLLSSPEMSKPRRMQGAFLSEKEIERVVGYLKSESAPDYNYQITEGASAGGGVSMNGEDNDPLMEDAVQIVLESGKASTSFLQRRMKIGYSRAARIIDIMEQMGIISAQDGAKPRDILVTEWPPVGQRKVKSEKEKGGFGDRNMGRDSFDDAVTGMNNEDEENEDDDEDFPEIDDVDAPLDTDDDGEEDGEELKAEG